MKRTLAVLALVAGIAASVSGCAVYEGPPGYGYGGSAYVYQAAPPPPVVVYRAPPPMAIYGGPGWGWHPHHHWR